MHEHLIAAYKAMVGHPLFPLILTMVAYLVAVALAKKLKWGILQPLLVGVIIIIPVLLLLQIDLNTYYTGNAVLTTLLGPSIVALAVPLCQNFGLIRRYFLPVVITAVIGGFFATGVTIFVGELLHVDFQLLMSLATKSITSPVTFLIAGEIGAVVPLSVAFVLVAGITGVIIGPFVLRYSGIRHPAAVGMTMGLTTHAFGTVWALEQNEEAGGFAALAMTVMAIVAAILLPTAIKLFM